jgi:hypothetical protein
MALRLTPAVGRRFGIDGRDRRDSIGSIALGSAAQPISAYGDETVRDVHDLATSPKS